MGWVQGMGWVWGCKMSIGWWIGIWCGMVNSCLPIKCDSHEGFDERVHHESTIQRAHVWNYLKNIKNDRTRSNVFK